MAKKALEDGKTVKEVAVEEGYLTADEADKMLDPEAMTHRVILGTDN
ncbi:MAG: fumarase [Halonotius sp. J07HN6]|nr:MAG: fumarase [Halonotius sp. J07HN6]